MPKESVNQGEKVIAVLKSANGEKKEVTNSWWNRVKLVIKRG